MAAIQAVQLLYIEKD